MDVLYKQIGGVKYPLKFSYRSLMIIGDNFEIPSAEIVDKKPLLVFKQLGTLLYGALNWANDKSFTEEEVNTILETYAAEGGDIVKLLDELMTLLNESVFFQNLTQKSETMESTETNLKKKQSKKQ